MHDQWNPAWMVISIVRPVLILIIIVFNFLGAGVYRYLGGSIDWILLGGGLVCSILLHCSCLLLNAFFNLQMNEKYHSGYMMGTMKPENIQVEKRFLLSVSLITLTTGSTMFFVISFQNGISPLSLLVYFVALTSCIVYSVPPFKLTSRGLGEVVLAILISNLYPVFAFVLQSGEMHRLVGVITFPLTLLLLASFLSSELSTYLQDMLDRKLTLLQVLKWNMGISLHNSLIGLSYLFVGIAAFFGLSRSLTFPFLFSIPLSLLSINEVIRIGRGNKPRWSVLLLSSYGSIGCTIYMLTFALWTY